MNDISTIRMLTIPLTVTILITLFSLLTWYWSVKEEGKENDLVDRIAADPAFGMTKEQIMAIMEPKNFVGRAPQQTEEFLKEVVQPILDRYKDVLGMEAEINV